MLAGHATDCSDSKCMPYDLINDNMSRSVKTINQIRMNTPSLYASHRVHMQGADKRITTADTSASTE